MNINKNLYNMDKLEELKYQNSLLALRFNEQNSKGRVLPESNQHNSCFFADIKKINNSLLFQRLKGVTQLFCINKYPGIATKLDHSLMVLILSRRCARILGLNKELASAIALSHDIAHCPYSHLGERTISKMSRKKLHHAKLAAIYSETLKDLNLSYEVVQGILFHSRSNGMLAQNEVTQEAILVRFCDKISFISSDILASLKCNFFSMEKLPLEILESIYQEIENGDNVKEVMTRDCNSGKLSTKLADYFVDSLIKESSEMGFVSFSESKGAKQFKLLSEWIQANLYQIVDYHQDLEKKKFNLREIFELFLNEPVFKDYNPYLLLSLLTDHEAESLKWSRRNGSNITSMKFFKIAKENFRKKDIDIFNYELDPTKYHKQAQTS